MSHIVTSEDVAAMISSQEVATDGHPIGGVRITEKPADMINGIFSDKPVPPHETSPLCELSEEEKKVLTDAKINVKKVHIIVNPFSGNGKGQKSLEIVTATFEERKIECTIHKTEHPGHATELAKTVSLDDHDSIVIIGGDGTFNEAINGYLHREDCHKPIGLVAGGTGNSVLNSLKLKDPKHMAYIIADGLHRGVDVGKVTILPGENNEEKVTYMMNMIGWGLGVDANVTAEKLRFFGNARYDMGAVWHIINSFVSSDLRMMKCTIDGDVLEGAYDVILIQNNQHSGDDMRIAPRSKMDDGLMDIMFSKQLGGMTLVTMFGELKRNGSHMYLDTLEYRQFKKLRIESAPALINVDGENIHGTPFELEVLPRKLHVFLPLEWKAASESASE